MSDLEKIQSKPIYERPYKKFDINDFGGLRDDEYVKDDMIYCKKCGGERLFVYGNFRARTCCDCMAKKLEDDKLKKQLEEKQNYINEKFKILSPLSILGEIYKNNRFETTDKISQSFDSALSRCKAYCDNIDEVLKNGYGIYLYGETGVGKTHITSCMVNRLISSGFTALFTNFIEISKCIRNSFLNANESEQNIVEMLYSLEFLFIDDIGTERMQLNNSKESFISEKIYDILNQRMINKKCTIFTSNYSLGELVSDRGYPEKTVDRILKLSSARIKIVGESYRKKQAKELKLPF